MKKLNNTNKNYKPKQLKLPLEIERIIEISDPVYSFSEIVDCIDLNSYFAKKGCKTGRPRYNRTNLLKVILFSFMKNGYLSLRGIEKSCKTDIRYMYLLDDMDAPSFVTIGNFIRDSLTNSIENIFIDINKVIFSKENVDLTHTYIKETKNEKYRNNPYRAVNFAQDEDGDLVCPNGKKFKFRNEQHVRGNSYGRTEEIYECESCEDCKHKQECCPKANGNRTIRLNRELTNFHEEVIHNLGCIHGALLCMNRSIQAEGTFGIIKCDTCISITLK